MGEECVAPARSVFASRRILCWCGLVQHPAKLSLFILGELAGARGLRLQKGSQEDTVVEPGAYAAQVPIVQLLPDSLSLKYFGFAFPATLAEHDVVYPARSGSCRPAKHE